MSETEALEARIDAALGRILSGVETLETGEAPAVPDTPPEYEGEIAALQSALEAERAANAQLEKRVLAISERQETQFSKLEGRVGELSALNEKLESENAFLKQHVTRLRDSNAALRAANQSGLGDAELVNASLETELASLTALRNADRAELDDILATLKPLTGER